ncbi:hypothetical protein BDV28DRAFT_31309 [Aspergillus coremiiformis]|uniref:Secreted protein n=1 Tax=Aspergillus coremiiformis TaxID=138285 RepID=A0A5N6Z0W9_9EURO|nr:hypothetical protein BDV28DRAFT_31309 [Aspergillus coremiiformis]
MSCNRGCPAWIHVGIRLPLLFLFSYPFKWTVLSQPPCSEGAGNYCHHFHHSVIRLFSYADIHKVRCRVSIIQYSMHAPPSRCGKKPGNYLTGS